MGGIEYSTTKEPTVTTTESPHYAGFWLRAGSLLIDGVVVAVVELLLAVLLGIGEGSVVVFVFVFAYYILGTAWGATLGKYVLRLRVVNVRGEAPGLASSLVRSVVVAVSALALLVGYLWMIWDRDKQTWHDKAAKTYVIRV